MLALDPYNVARAAVPDTNALIAITTGVVVMGGTRVLMVAAAFAPLKGDIWIRNGLGKIRQARVERVDETAGYALLKLAEPLAPFGKYRCKPSRLNNGVDLVISAHTHRGIRAVEATAGVGAAVVAAGDLIGASPLLSAFFHDEGTIETMNRLGLEFNAVGNHEFDEGKDELLRMQNGGCHPTDPASTCGSD